jgi:pimeloyl-ACP methyl ester carboxylesterase
VLKFALPDGRTLYYEVSGKADGRPVFLHHGMPGSASGPKPRNSILYRHGIRLISYSRPGYGGSTRRQGRSVADAAEDVLALAAELGLDRFAVLGRSGGGPHALACAGLLPERVTRAAALVSFAPLGAIGLDWYRDMAESNQRSYQVAAADGALLAERLRLETDRVRRDPGHLLRRLREEMPAADLRIVNDFAIESQLLQTYAVGLREGPGGWIDDVLALSADWGFDLEDIRVPVRLWHGAEDQFAPASHTRWLAERIPGATAEVEHGKAHFAALEVMLQLLTWLVGTDPLTLAVA